MSTKVVGSITSAFPGGVPTIAAQSEALDPPMEDAALAEGRDANRWTAEILALITTLGVGGRGEVTVTPGAPPIASIGSLRVLVGRTLTTIAAAPVVPLTPGAINKIYANLDALTFGVSLVTYPATGRIITLATYDATGPGVFTDDRPHLPTNPGLAGILLMQNTTGTTPIVLSAGSKVAAATVGGGPGLEARVEASDAVGGGAGGDVAVKVGLGVAAADGFHSVELPFGAKQRQGNARALLAGLAGATVTAPGIIPAGSILLGVTVRVTTTITGAASFDIGDGVDVDRFGAAVALPAGTTTTLVNHTGGAGDIPALFAAAGSVVLTANGGAFTGGAVRVVAHYLTLVAPTS